MRHWKVFQKYKERLKGVNINFRNIKPEYSKYKILAEKNGFILAKYVESKDFYMFGSEDNFNFSSFPTNQCGMLEEVLKELKRWKNEVDCNNPFMLEIENEFISTLQKIA